MGRPRIKEKQTDSLDNESTKRLLQWHPVFCAGIQIELEEENLWLKNLTDDLKGQNQAEKLVKEYQKHKNNTLYQAMMDIIIRANKERFEEAKNMCDALRELFAEELEEKYQAGESEGRREGRSELSRLILKLSELGRTDDIVKAAENPEYQEQLMKELNI